MTYLSLNSGVPECEEEPLAVVSPQPVNAPGVNGSAEVVVHLLLRVPLLLVPAGPNAQPEKFDRVSNVTFRA